MKKLYLTVVLACVCLVVLGTSARAQSPDAVVVTVPFEFVAGSATFQAGDYRIGRLSSSTNDELAIVGYDKGGTFLRPMMFNEVPSDNPALSFQHAGGKYFLSKITTFRGVYTLPPRADASSSSGTN